MKKYIINNCDLRHKLSRELRLILTLLSKINRKADTRLPSENGVNIDWDKFLKLSRQHCVGPLILNAARQAAPAVLPEGILNTLASEHKSNIFVSMNLSDALCRLAGQFKRTGLPMISLKGPALAQTLFEDTSLRLSNDLDILVRVGDLESVEALLRDLGYRSVGKKRLLTKKQRALFQKVHHHRNFVHSETRVNLEVHWRLSRLKNRCLRDYPFDRLWCRSERIILNGVSVPILDSSDNLLYLCLHGAYHQWSRLSWVYDVYEISKRRPIADMKKLLCRHKCSVLGDALAQVLVLLDLVFATDYSRRLENEFNFDRGFKLAFMTIPFLETFDAVQEPTLFSGRMYQIIAYMLFFQREYGDKIRYAAQLLMPTHLEIQTLSIPDGLYPFYFLVHPVCTLYRSVVNRVGMKDPFVAFEGNP